MPAVVDTPVVAVVDGFPLLLGLCAEETARPLG